MAVGFIKNAKRFNCVGLLIFIDILSDTSAMHSQL